MDNAGLTESLVRGDTEDLLAVYDAYGDRLYAYGWALLDDEKQAAEAVRDALLVAAVTADNLRQPALLGPWLYAVVRNECLRRRDDPTQPLIPAADEIAELAGRHRMDAAAIAAVLGVSVEDIRDRVESPAAALDPLPFVVAPAALRDDLGTAAAPDGVAHRLTLAKRARPFNSEGFPVPLDRRRISGRTLAWSTAVAVVVALGVLLTVPVEGDGSGGRVLAAVVPVGPDFSTLPAPALRSSPAAPDPITWPANRSGIARPVGTAATGAPLPAAGSTAQVSAVAATTAAPSPSPTRMTGSAVTTSSGTAVVAAADSSSGASSTASAAVVTVTSGYSVHSVSCAGQWSASVWAQVDGASDSEILSVYATWQGGATTAGKAALERGPTWTGLLGRLPVGQALVWTVHVTLTGGRTATSAAQSMSYYCHSG